MINKTKKICLLILAFCILCSSTFVSAQTTSKWKTNQNKTTVLSNGIIESNLETKDLGVVNGKRRKEYTLTYTIPQNYNEDVVTIVPNKYIDNCTMPGDDDIFNIVIKNESVNTYSYLNNSFILSTDDYDSYSDNELGTPINNVYSFSGSKLREQLGFYRTKNSALRNLYGVKSASSITSAMLSDSEIDKVIDKNKYPNGVLDLNKYYLDFYNNKYQTNATTLEDLPDKAISELFNGNYTKSFKETNNEVIELAYNYLYNKLIAFTFDQENINDDNSENFSVGSYMRKEASYVKANSLFIDKLNNMEPKANVVVTMPHVYINGKYMTNIYQNYNINFYIELKLVKKTTEQKNDTEEPKETKEEENNDESVSNDNTTVFKVESVNDYPLPPNTNVD
ncbi:MAG TPA: hypothetical protein OIM63_02440 [Bacilli bacterium]|nr:hypothetical protein [Bacilli bacterium]